MIIKEGYARVARDTTANWKRLKTFIPKAGEVIVYTDRSRTVDNEGNEILHPGIKIGDGKAYLVDLPFAGGAMEAGLMKVAGIVDSHLADTAAHVSAEDRVRWDNKLDLDVEDESEVLILSPAMI